MQNYSNLYNDPLKQYKSNVRPLNMPNTNNPKKNLLESYANVQRSVNDLFTSKYGKGNYDINKGWANQSSNPLGSWNDMQEAQGLNLYNKYMTDMYNSKSALNEYNMLEQNKAQNMAQANVYKEQAEKYIPNQLAMYGMGNVGSSESSLVGIGNNYQRSISDIQNNTNQSVIDLIRNYGQAISDSDTNLANQNSNILRQYQDSAWNNAAINITNQLDKNTAKQNILDILNSAKGQVSNSQYEDLLQKAKYTASALGISLEDIEIPSGLGDITNQVGVIPQEQSIPVSNPTTNTNPNNANLSEEQRKAKYVEIQNRLDELGHLIRTSPSTQKTNEYNAEYDKLRAELKLYAAK